MADPDWTLWRSFLAVVQTGSLSQAARHLRLTQPTLGRHIALLEAALGAMLFTRSNDGLRPTALALSLRPQAEVMAAAAASLGRIASGEAKAEAGLVRLTASEFMGQTVLPSILADFARGYPAIDIDLVLTDQNLDLLRGDADLAVRNAEPEQSQLVVRRLGEVPVRLYAHRRYADRHSLPRSLDELQTHVLIGRADYVAYAKGIPALAGRSWRFAFSSSSDVALLGAVRAGLGIGACQTGVAQAEPDLLPVMPDMDLATVPIWLAMHEDRRVLRRVRLLFDHLAVRLKAYVDGAPR